jgi:predicted Zn-dependent protease
LAHARAAKDKAPRLAQAREILGVAAYAAEDYALARSELRAARRITGSIDLLPMLADCERGLGHPERALTVAAEPDARRLRPEEKIELAMVVSGARLDLGEPQAAVQALNLPALATESPTPTTIRLWYAYADALVAAGRKQDAIEYFGRVVRSDEDETTDAEQRLVDLADAESRRAESRS